jgi:GGDEF domain-containing protein
VSSSLTGVSQLHVDMANLLREGELQALVQFDIDSFSTINEDRGIEVGDRVLEILEKLVRDAVKSAYRTGSDQFVLLQSDRQGTWNLCSEFCRECERTLGFAVTVSGGGLVIDPEFVLATPQSVHLLSGAVAEIQAVAKRRGRNSILWLEAADSEPESEISETARKLFLNLAKLNASTARQMAVESRIDVLTGLYNRRGFEDIFGREVEGPPEPTSRWRSSILIPIPSSRSTTRMVTKPEIGLSWTCQRS